jgi:peptidoglycan/xylan/chitin deacetylase (PgdA/CDA1 family)
LTTRSLVASRRSLLLDTHRIPYDVVHEGDGSFASIGAAGRPGLMWPGVFSADDAVRRFEIDGLTAWGRLLSEQSLRRLLPEGHWAIERPVRVDGVTTSSMLRSERGDVALPFDPDDCIRTVLEERYLGQKGQRRTLSRRLYYRVRPFMPRSVQLQVRRRFTRVQERVAFPAWPAESALHDLDQLILDLLESVLGWMPPSIATWPKGTSWALVLTHDVERASGYAFVEELAQIERELGFRSAFFLVPERDYRVEPDVVNRLRADGFEVGVHGLRHDGRDMEPHVLAKRLPVMRRYADEWGATGFRAPATHRDLAAMPRLGFDYDSSYSDTARYEPQPGGSCSLLPYFIGDLVELPITLPMDHTLFEILLEPGERRWVEKAEWLRERGGMALMLTHPDYLLDRRVLRAYERFLLWVRDDSTCWKALPSDVSAWWRTRASAELVLDGGTWVPRGRGAERMGVVS